MRKDKIEQTIETGETPAMKTFHFGIPPNTKFHVKIEAELTPRVET